MRSQRVPCQSRELPSVTKNGPAPKLVPPDRLFIKNIGVPQQNFPPSPYVHVHTSARRWATPCVARTMLQTGYLLKLVSADVLTFSGSIVGSRGLHRSFKMVHHAVLRTDPSVMFQEPSIFQSPFLLLSEPISTLYYAEPVSPTQSPSRTSLLHRARLPDSEPISTTQSPSARRRARLPNSEPVCTIYVVPAFHHSLLDQVCCM